MRRLALFVLVYSVACLLPTAAQEFQPNATITAEFINVREEPARLTWRSLMTWRFELGRSVEVLHEGARVQILEHRVVIGTHDWYRVRFRLRDGQISEGWVYAGPVGDHKYLDVSDGGHSLRSPFGSSALMYAGYSSALPSVVRTAGASSGSPAAGGLLPKDVVHIVVTLALLISFLAGSWFAVHKLYPPPPHWPSLMVILIEAVIVGAIGPEQLVQIVSNVSKIP